MQNPGRQNFRVFDLENMAEKKHHAIRMRNIRGIAIFSHLTVMLPGSELNRL
jgi:hypothetical protein